MKILNAYPFKFAEDFFTIYLTEDMRFWIPLRPLCEALGVAYAGQAERANRDRVLVEKNHLCMLRTPIVRKDGVAQDQDVLCISVEKVHYFMGGMSLERIKPELQEKVFIFKDQMGDAIWASLRSQTLPDEVRAELDARLSPKERRFYQLMDEAAALKEQIRDQGQRIEKLEMRLAGTDFISLQQAKQYLDAVGVLGNLLKERDRKIASPYAVIHARVKDRFRVPSYQLIPESDFPAVMEFLASWWKKEAPEIPVPEIFLVRQDRLL